MTEDEKRAKATERVYRMPFGTVYPLYIQKAERKGRTRAEVDQIIAWLTGYDSKALAARIADGTDFETFFRLAPKMNPNVSKITGMICGYRVEEIEDEIIVNADFNLPLLADEILPVFVPFQSKPTAPTRNLSFMRYESAFRLMTCA